MSVTRKKTNRKTLNKGVEVWIRFAQKAEKIALDILRESNVKSPKGVADPNVIAYLLLIRTITNCRGARILIKQGLTVEARILARNCIENFLWIGALAHDSDKLITRMRNHDLKHKQMQGQRMLQSVPASEKEKLKNLRKYLKHSSKNWPDVETITPLEVAKMGKITEAYLFYSELSADSGHPTTESLSRYLVRYDVQGVTKRGYTLKPPPMKVGEDIESIWYASWALFGSCVGVNEISKASPHINRRLVKLENDYHRLYGETQPQTGE